MMRSHSRRSRDRARPRHNLTMVTHRQSYLHRRHRQALSPRCSRERIAPSRRVPANGSHRPIHNGFQCPAAKKSEVYFYFLAEKRAGQILDKFVCIHKDHKGRPDVRIAHSGTTTNLKRHLRDEHGIEFGLSSKRSKSATGSQSAVPRAASVTNREYSQAQYAPLTSYFSSSHASPYSSHHPTQRAFLRNQLEFILSTLSPDSLVEDPSYRKMIQCLDPRLSGISRTTLSRSVTRMFQGYLTALRQELLSVPVLHINTDMWTSVCNEPYASFVVSFVDEKWCLQTKTLRCCMLPGRHTARLIAPFCLQVASDFGVRGKVGVIRTDDASNCVSAGLILGREAGRTKSLHESMFQRSLGASGRINALIHDVTSSITEDDAAFVCVSAPTGVSDAEDDGSTSGESDSGFEQEDSLKDAETRITDFAKDMNLALEDERMNVSPAAAEQSRGTMKSEFLWQYGRCSTHTLQLSVRYGLAAEPLKSLVEKVRAIARLSKQSTNFQREVYVAVHQREEIECMRRTGGATRPNCATRLKMDCCTRWGSTLSMIRRFLTVSDVIPIALASYYNSGAPSGSRLEGLSRDESNSLQQAADFLAVLESASASLGSQHSVTSSLEETVYWYIQHAGRRKNTDLRATAVLKERVTSDMRCRRLAVMADAASPDWFGIRVGAVLLDPWTKTFDFGGEQQTAAIARRYVLAVSAWMVGHGKSATLEEEPADTTQENTENSLHDSMTFLQHLRSFTKGAHESQSQEPSALGSVHDTHPSSAAHVEKLISEEFSEYQRMLMDKSTMPENALEWGRIYHKMFPRISLAAKYFLAIPASTVSSERLFSKAGRTIRKGRARLTGPNAEKYIVLNDELARCRHSGGSPFDAQGNSSETLSLEINSDV